MRTALSAAESASSTKSPTAFTSEGRVVTEYMRRAYSDVGEGGDCARRWPRGWSERRFQTMTAAVVTNPEPASTPARGGPDRQEAPDMLPQLKQMQAAQRKSGAPP